MTVARARRRRRETVTGRRLHKSARVKHRGWILAVEFIRCDVVYAEVYAAIVAEGFENPLGIVIGNAAVPRRGALNAPALIKFADRARGRINSDGKRTIRRKICIVIPPLRGDSRRRFRVCKLCTLDAHQTERALDSRCDSCCAGLLPRQ